MSTAKQHHCFNCGADLGVYEAYYGDLQNCGSGECNRAEQDIHRSERDEAHEKLDRDMGWDRF